MNESTADAELTQDTGEHSDDPVMEALLNRP